LIHDSNGNVHHGNGTFSLSLIWTSNFQALLTCTVVPENIHTFPLNEVFSQTPPHTPHTPLRKFQLSLIHFFICFDVREPPTPQVFQSLLGSMGSQYGYFLELHNHQGYSYMYASFIIMYAFGQTCLKCQAKETITMPRCVSPRNPRI